MRKIALILVLVLTGFVRAENPVTLDTQQTDWQLWRAEANENASLLDLTVDTQEANRPALSVANGMLYLKAREDGTGSGVNLLQFMIAGGAAADKTLTYTITAWGRNGPAIRAYSGTATLGTQQVRKYPVSGSTATDKFWADTVMVTTSNWPDLMKLPDSVGNNSICIGTIDTNGFPYWLIQISSADGSTGTEAGLVSVYYRTR